MTKRRIVVMGFMAGIPIAGVIWQHLHYIVGLQRLGHEVWYLEDSARWTYDPETQEYGLDYGYAVRLLDRLAQRFGFEDHWGFCARHTEGLPTAGMPRARMLELIHGADAVFNVCGAQEMHEDIADGPNFIYLESDPGVEQIRIDNGDPAPREYLSKHRALFTFGENIGTDRFPVPLHDFHWMPTRQPIVTDFWKTESAPPDDAIFTTIANWNTSGVKDIEWRGNRYLWSKSLEFLKFADAPERAAEPFELATNIREVETRDRLFEHGWRLTNAGPISNDLDAYVSYIRQSKGEFTVAKDQYVRLETGWFSDRSACYLAAGRPVITQETGFSKHLGSGAGLLAFSTADEITERVKEIRADYQKHSAAASAIATECFEATRVVRSILERAGV